MSFLNNIVFQAIDWSNVERTTHAGERGQAFWQTVQAGAVRVRLVEYSANYLADHWCERGHVVHILSGILVTELKDGREFTLEEGQTYVVGDNDGAHRSRCVDSVKLFIVD